MFILHYKQTWTIKSVNQVLMPGAAVDTSGIIVVEKSIMSVTFILEKVYYKAVRKIFFAQKITVPFPPNVRTVTSRADERVLIKTDKTII